METTDLQFEFFLAENLGKTVGEIREMPAAEFQQWWIYYARAAQKRQLEHLRKGGRRG
jgi:hypothetical protein